MNKAQWKILAVGIPGIIGMGLFSFFYTNTYNSLDEINRIHLSEVIAAIIGITIFVIRKKFQTPQLEPYELLMIIMVGAIAGVNLIPENFDRPTIVITISVAIIVGWFVYCGLWKYIAEKKEIDSRTFFTMLLIFLGLTIVIMLGFNIHRIIQLFTPDSL